MATSRTCPECGATLSSQSPYAPCPACLMKLGLRTWEQHADGQPGPTRAREDGVDGLPADKLSELFPQLEILELLGQGGMGAVYKARQKSLDRMIALKVIRPSTAKDARFAERFVREARALAQLSHPNIVTVHDFGQVGQLYFFIMEYVDGLNLRQMLQSGTLDPGEALEIVPHICDALQFAHDEGVVHRDIKPENILIDKKGRVKIADFGLAKLLKPDAERDALTKTNHVMGTPHYMAPEQIEHPLSVDHRADIYSLGVVLYEMLTGELPIGRFAPPSQRVCVDVRLDKVVLRSLEKQPELRYQSISEVKTDMASVGDHAADAWDARLAPQSVGESAPPPQPAPQPVAKPIPPRVPPEKPPRIPAKPAYYESSHITTVDSWLSGKFLGVLRQRQSYLNLLYLLLAFPLGVFYFVFLVTGFSLGIGLLIVWVGALILLGMLVGVRGLGALERVLTTQLLHVDIPAPDPPPMAPDSKWRQAVSLLGDSTTWSTLVYLLLKFPLGIISFALPITIFGLALQFISSFFFFNLSWLPGPTIGGWRVSSFPEAAVLSVLGLVLLPVSLHMANGLAQVNGWLATVLLARRQP